MGEREKSTSELIKKLTYIYYNLVYDSDTESIGIWGAIYIYSVHLIVSPLICVSAINNCVNMRSYTSHSI